MCAFVACKRLQIYLICPSFLSQVDEAARCTNEPVKKTSRSILLIRSSSLVRFVPKKRLLIAVVDKGNGAKAFNSKKCLWKEGG